MFLSYGPRGNCTILDSNFSLYHTIRLSFEVTLTIFYVTKNGPNLFFSALIAVMRSLSFNKIDN